MLPAPEVYVDQWKGMGLETHQSQVWASSAHPGLCNWNTASLCGSPRCAVLSRVTKRMDDTDLKLLHGVRAH